MHAPPRSWFLPPLLALIAVALAGCSATGPAAPLPRGSISDLADKLSLIVQDECETRPAASVYARCARFTAELTNVAIAAQSAAAGRPGAAAAQDAATKLSGALTTFTQDGCLGAAPASAAKCADNHALVQRLVKELDTAVAAVPSG